MPNTITKKLIMTLTLMLAIIGGIHFSTSNTVSAAPFVTIDYGETRHGHRVWWVVDKGSLDLCDLYTGIEVNLENEYNLEEHWIYKFYETKNGWGFSRVGYTGKGAQIKSHEKATGKLVANDKLANDILYIALH